MALRASSSNVDARRGNSVLALRLLENGADIRFAMAPGNARGLFIYDAEYMKSLKGLTEAVAFFRV